MFALIDKYDKGLIQGSDYAALQSALAAARNNSYLTANSSVGSSRVSEYVAMEAKLAAAAQSAYYKSLAPAGGGAFGGYSTPATQAAARTVNVNLNVSGKTVPVQTSSANADQLLKLLTDAQRAAGGP
jgi:hypothetical protein